MKRAPLVLPASTPQDVDADQVAPPPDVIRCGEAGGGGIEKAPVMCVRVEGTLPCQQCHTPPPALDATELSMRWIGP